MTSRLRVVVAGPLSAAAHRILVDADPLVDIVHERALTGPVQAEPWTRPVELQSAYEQYIDSAEALLGVPDGSGAALARTVAANPKLRWVHTLAAGGGELVKAANLDRAALERVAFTTSAGVHAEPLAEFALFGVLAGAKLLPWLTELKGAKTWGARRVMRPAAEMTVAIVGLGAVGRATASKLSQIGYRVVGVHRQHREVPGISIVYPIDRLAEVLSLVDAVVLTLPRTTATEGMLSRTVLERAKPGLTVVNVGRGTTVDEDALIDALADGRVGLAVLDVVRQEPLPVSSPLWELPNVIISPHTAATSPQESTLVAELFADNARRLVAGEPLRNRVDVVEFY